ncbi:uncharacterized protein FTOL_10906 [Fusarium torulosum]|uniref:CFEM domain-containing protein n=1 Tax=Fusarium torulosum TaxID=33205 RepID=A0AAE8MIX0_9HYPO|nr:uncharacterized protein FTOL_10906 [Fusarium torulosum]
MKASSFVAALISAPALGQDLGGLPACAQSCALNAIGGSGCAATDVVCICTSQTFISVYSSCVSTSCNATDAAAATEFGNQFCASASSTVSPTTTRLSEQPSSTTASALQTAAETATGSSTAPIPTTLITTTDSAGNVFTVTGQVLISGTSTTTVPCRTVITTNAAGVTVTVTETGSSVSYKDKTQVRRS